MATRFPGFSKQMPAFLRGLEKHNERDWFAPRKEIFEAQLRAPMIQLVTWLNNQMRQVAPDHVAEDPARLIYRIYRDTRFSKDKTPYKTHIGATFFHRTLPRHGGAGYYFEVSHRYVGVAGGVYMPGPEELGAIRTAIAVNAKEFLALVSATATRKALGTLQGQRLTRLPKTLQDQAAAPVAEFLKMKQFYWWVELPASLALTPRLSSELLRHFRAMSPSLTWFNRAILAQRKEEAGDSETKRPAPMW